MAESVHNQASPATAAPLMELCGVVKKFPGVTALAGVDFTVRSGEIHALCGENGAGKSTLIKLLSGIHPHGSYEGTLKMEGKAIAFRQIRDAESAGVTAITQEFALVNELSIAENLFLGRPKTRAGMIDWPAMHHHAAELLKEFELPVQPQTLVKHLGIGQKQLIEIARAMDKKSRLLILDEPSAALTEKEVAVLLTHLRRLRQQGTACIYISHKLDEVFAIADRITILRDGSSIATLENQQTHAAEVIKLMVGREIQDLYPRRNTPPAADVLLSVKQLHTASASEGKPVHQDISFELRRGEVLGIGGLMGAGRTELLGHLFGAWGKRVSGEVLLHAKSLQANGPAESICRGLVMVTEDRRRYGLHLPMSIGFNLSLSSLKKTSACGGLNKPKEQVRNQGYFDKLRVKAPGQQSRVGGLSGGNQQKVVLAKALMTDPDVVLLDEPTRGIDIGAKQEVYELINRLVGEGKGVILVSSELPELMGMSDRIMMMHEGRIGGEFTRDQFHQEALLAAALGHHKTNHHHD